MESIRNVITDILPNLSDSKISAMMESLAVMGFQNIEDLEFLNCEKDLVTVLNTLEVRKLAAKLKLRFSDAPAMPCQSVPSTPIFTPTVSHSPPETPSPSPGTSTSTCLTSRSVSVQHALDKYTIPWKQLQLPKQLRAALAGSSRLPVPLMRKLVKCISEDILANVFKCDRGRPGKPFLERIAKQAMLQFPGAITTVLDGQVVGTGYDDLLHKLVNRFDNINRNVSSVIRQKRAFLNAEDDKSTEDIIDCDVNTPRCSSRRKPKSQKLSDKYGCIAWQPLEPDTTEADDAEKLRQELLDMSVEDEQFKEKFRKLYYFQRQDINSLLPVTELKTRWPYLFTADGLLIHFEELTGIDIMEQLTSSTANKIPRLLAYFKCGIIRKKPGVTAALSAISEAESSVGNKNPEIYGVISALTAYFNESISDLITNREVPLADREAEIPPTPFLLATGESVLTSNTFRLYIDHIATNTIQSSLVALGVQFAAFYVFNLCYTTTAAVTLEFIQRYLVGINPERGSKTKKPGKHQHHVNPLLLSLINDISSFEWSMQN